MTAPSPAARSDPLAVEDFGASSGGVLRVTGVKEVKAALKKLGRATERREFTAAYKRVARIAAADVARVVPTGPARGGHAKTKIKARATNASGGVLIPRRDVPYYGWLDFGGRTPNTGQPRSVGPWRGSGTGPGDGRYAYPTVWRNRPKYVRELDEALDEVAAKFNSGASL